MINGLTVSILLLYLHCAKDIKNVLDSWCSAHFGETIDESGDLKSLSLMILATSTQHSTQTAGFLDIMHSLTNLDDACLLDFRDLFDRQSNGLVPIEVISAAAFAFEISQRLFSGIIRMCALLLPLSFEPC
jgi:hypothetical protein